MNTNPSSRLSRLTFDSKSMIARLLASENLRVEEHVSAKTACFDLKTRRLILPVFGNMINNAYEMFIAHECGHAIYSPQAHIFEEGCKYINPENPMGAHAFVNIVEDTRIERLMKVKYPGLVHTFRAGYEHIIENGFFGESVKNLDKLSTIDRLNLAAKVGVHTDIQIPLDATEQAFFDRMMTTPSGDVGFQEVIVLAKEIYEYAKNRQQQMSQGEEGEEGGESAEDDKKSKKKNKKSKNGKKNGKKKQKKKNPSASPDDILSEDTPQLGESDVNDGESTEDGDGEGEDGEEGDEEGDGSEGECSEDGEGDEDGDSDGELEDFEKSDTQDMMKASLEKMISKNSSKNPVTYIDIPEINPAACIRDYKDVLSDFAKDTYFSKYPADYLSCLIETFKKNNKSLIHSLATEFELKKAADTHKRTQIAVSGNLNPGRLHTYKYAEDIFKRHTVVAEGKNHGMIMYIDWSGSMSGCMGATIRQLLSLVWFCKKVNIPFEVYAFSDNHMPSNDKLPKVKNSTNSTAIIASNFTLINFMSSRMNTKDFLAGTANLLSIARTYDSDKKTSVGNTTAYDGKYTSYPSHYGLTGTPLTDAVLTAFTLVPIFQKKHRVQIVNTIVLTDGESTNRVQNSESYYNNGDIVVRDPVTRSQIAYSCDAGRGGEVDALCELLRVKTQQNVIGIYMLPSKDSKKSLGIILNIKDEELNTEAANFVNKKFAVSKNRGYNSYYVLPSDDLDMDMDVKSTVIKAKNANDVSKEFLESSMKRMVNRVFLNVFVNEISIDSREKNSLGAISKKKG